MSFLRRHIALTDPRTRAVVWCAGASIVAFLLVGWWSPREASRNDETAIRASLRMQRALGAARALYLSRGLQFDETVDPNHTGLIGEEYTDITTTLGHLEAKRTTTNPAMGGLMVRLLREAGVVAGDTIAVGCSGSFPAMAIATLAAAEEMKVVPLVIVSLGASSFGANRKEMTLLDILSGLDSSNVVRCKPVAASLGGADDVGNEFEPDVREALLAKIRQSGIPLLYQPNLRLNVEQRLEKYFGAGDSRPIAAFVNIGGNYADMGTSPLILKTKPGVNKLMEIPDAKESHGVVFAMANRHIPLVHVLNIRDLALEYGIPWDPIPIPAVAETSEAPRALVLASPAGMAVLLYGLILLMILILHRKAFVQIPS